MLRGDDSKGGNLAAVTAYSGKTADSRRLCLCVSANEVVGKHRHWLIVIWRLLNYFQITPTFVVLFCRRLPAVIKSGRNSISLAKKSILNRKLDLMITLAVLQLLFKSNTFNRRQDREHR